MVARNFLQEKSFANFTTCYHWQKFLSVNFLSCVNDYVEDVVTLIITSLANIYSIEYFCNAKVAGLGEIFIKRNFQLYGTSLYNTLLAIPVVAV